MIRALHVIEGLAWYGGTPRKLLSFAKHAQSLGHEMHFLCYLPVSEQKEMELAGVRFAHNPDTLSQWHLVRAIAGEARRLKVDAICTHFSRPLITGRMASAITGIPIIHHEHASAHYRRGIARMVSKWCIPSCRGIVCNSHHTARTIIEAYKVPKDKVFVVHNPVAVRLTEMGARKKIRTELGVSADAIIVGHIGGMIKERDQATLIKALAMVNRAYGNVKLVIIGDGPEKESLQVIIRQLKLDRNVCVVGYTERVGEYMSAMDIYVNPTLDEGFGIAVVEAMLAKLPVVLANAGAHPELIVDNRTGLLYCPLNAGDLAEKLSRLINDASERKRLGEYAHASAVNNFSPQSSASKYFELIRRICLG
jgi:glycosyltransferase involved in cell wall biosynthesis